MLYHLDFHVEYPASMSRKDLFSIWAREAEAALGAKKGGVVIDPGNVWALGVWWLSSMWTVRIRSTKFCSICRS